MSLTSDRPHTVNTTHAPDNIYHAQTAITTYTSIKSQLTPPCQSPAISIQSNEHSGQMQFMITTSLSKECPENRTRNGEVGSDKLSTMQI